MFSKDIIGVCVYYAFHQTVGLIGSSVHRAGYCAALTELLSDQGAIDGRERSAESNDNTASIETSEKLTLSALHRIMAKAEGVSGRLSAEFVTHLKMSHRLLSALHQVGYRVAAPSAQQVTSRSDLASQHGAASRG